jgi:hypothetical protein
MASSVSSESAFSAAGITISKRWNRLGGDIVEALQCLKSFIHQDLIFHEVVNAAQVLRHGRDVHPAWVNVVTAALATKVVRGSGDES